MQTDQKDKALPQNLSPIEKEVLLLKSSVQIINNIVNQSTISLHHADPDSEVHPKSSTDQLYFNIILADFLSRPDGLVATDNSTYLDALLAICSEPHFDFDSSIENLKTSATDFKLWLDTCVTIERMWFPNINLDINLQIKRSEFIKMTGNTSKHNITRTMRQARFLQSIFQKNNKDVSFEEAVLALENFHEWFQEDGNIFGYHLGTLAEFLNNIRWGIHDYLTPEYSRSIEYYTEGSLKKYRFKYPPAVISPLGKHYYWDLMNDFRSGPYMPRFTVTRFMKMRY
jgi:hypothetical protein